MKAIFVYMLMLIAAATNNQRMQKWIESIIWDGDK